MGPTEPRGEAPRRVAPPRRTLAGASPRPPAATLLGRRLRAARELGIPAPALTTSPTTSPRGRLAALDRRIARELDLAGGKRLPPWDEGPEDDSPPPRDRPGDDDGEDLSTPSSPRS